MFENCSTMLELQAERSRLQLNNWDGYTETEVNNAYNSRKQEIIRGHVHRFEFKRIQATPRPVQQYCGVPIAGDSPKPGHIILTENGFLI